VVTTDNEEPGEAWIQIHPDYTFLYEEMVTYIEEHLADRVGDIGYVKLYVNEGSGASPNSGACLRCMPYKRLKVL